MEQPTGTVTFLFTDIVGSTRMWEADPSAMTAAMADHDRILRKHLGTRQCFVFKTMGDAFCAAFASPSDAVEAAMAAQRELVEHPWIDGFDIAVRMALHTGQADSRDGDYFGPNVNRVARILGLAHGRQVIASDACVMLLKDACAGAEFRPLGEVLLRGLAEPETVYQLLANGIPCDFPPIKSTRLYPTNLPESLSSFIGRERELAEVLRMLEGSRLVTLSGAGGSGKTRLALEVAADLLPEFPDGAWLVELAPLIDPSQVPRTFATPLGLQEPADGDFTAALCKHLAARKALIVLDNCEHLLDSAASLVEVILRAAPSLKILTTSREGLSVPGESNYRVPSLDVPRPGECRIVEDLTRFDATRLFVERARASDATFVVPADGVEAIATVCRRLDGIPLAVELAAARARTLPLKQLVERLEDRFRILTGGSRTVVSRQQTLRALVDWSYDLLSEQERELLRYISVFADGWTLEAAEAVGASDSLERWEVVDLLSHLVDKSMVVYDAAAGAEGRYHMLETIRQYARERLFESGQAESARSRHADFFAPRIEAAAASLNLSNHFAIHYGVHEDQENYLAAADWQSGSDPDAGLRLTRLLCSMGDLSLVERASLLERALQRFESVASAKERFATALLAANVEMRRTHSIESLRYAKLAREIALEHGDEVGAVQALNSVGIAMGLIDSTLEVREVHEEVVRESRRLGEKRTEARGLHGLMLYYRRQGDLPAWKSMLDEIAAAGPEPNTLPLLWLSFYRACYCIAIGDLGEAAVWLAHSMQYADTLVVTAWEFHLGADLCVRSGRAADGARLFGCADACLESLAWPKQVNELPRLRAIEDALLEALGTDYEDLYALGRGTSAEDGQRVLAEICARLATEPAIFAPLTA